MIAIATSNAAVPAQNGCDRLVIPKAYLTPKLAKRTPPKTPSPGSRNPVGF